MVDLDSYRGPLGLLLHLVRSQDLDIFDIPVARITRQFLDEVRESGVLELDAAGEFLETAAMLLRIKSRLLLPNPDESQQEDPRSELVRRLLEYEQIQELSLRLKSAEEWRLARFVKGIVPQRAETKPTDIELELEWSELEAAARELTPPPPPPQAPVRTVTVAQKTVLVSERLEEVERIEFRGLLTGFTGRAHVSATLLACLEMARRRLLRLRQLRQFSPLWVYRAQDRPQGAGAGGSGT